MYEKPTLSIWEYISLPIALTRIAIAFVGAAVGTVFRGRDGAVTAKRHFLYGGMKAVVENLSTRQFQALSPTTIEAYEAFAKEAGFKPEVVEVADGTVGGWFGDKDADTVFVWFHGGGYSLPAGRPFMVFLSNLVKQYGPENSKLAVFLPQYDLAPQGKYPRQLEQASATIKYLTETLGKSYSQLLVGGDSAGAHLTISLLSHLAHPHPAIPALENANQGIKGAVLLSPMVGFTQTSQAFERNKAKDCLSGKGLKSWSEAMMKSTTEDNYNTPIDAPAEWWQDIKAEKTIVLAGGDEILIDDIQKFAEKLKEYNAEKVEVLVAPGECHAAPIGNIMLGIQEQPGLLETRLYQWVAEQV